MPRLPNTQIYGGLGDGGGESRLAGPFGTMGAMMQLKEQGLKLKELQDAQEDDDAIKATMQRYDRPDEAVGDLYHQGRVKAAGLLAKDLYAQRKQQQEDADAQVKSVGSRMEMATQIAQGITDEPSFQNGRNAIGALLHPVFGDAIYDQLGNSYDPEHMKAIVAYGTKRTDELKQQQDAITNARAATDAQYKNLDSIQKWQDGQQKARDYWHGAASQSLSTATSQPQWDYYMRLLHSQGAPDDVLRDYGSWDPQAPARATQLGLSVKDRATIEHEKKAEQHQTTMEEQGQKRIDLEGRRVTEYESRDGDGTTPGTRGKGLSASHISDIRARYHSRLSKWREDDPNNSEERLQIENDMRTERGWPTLQDAAAQYHASGNTAKRDEAMGIYKDITGKDIALPTAASRPATPLPVGGRAAGPGVSLTPAARRALLVTLTAKAKTETDPATLADLQKQIAALAVR